jgi:hypothetical protein
MSTGDQPSHAPFSAHFGFTRLYAASSAIVPLVASGSRPGQPFRRRGPEGLPAFPAEPSAVDGVSGIERDETRSPGEAGPPTRLENTMKTNVIAARALLVGLLSAATPSLAHAMPGDAHDDATYPEVAPGEAQQAGIAIAYSGGPEPYAHDDATYGSAPLEPARGADAAATVAVTEPVDSMERDGR